MPIRAPAVDVHSVGAGGGSIAWIDAGGALRVGPQSAGAVPGPAAYGHATTPTVTDAHVVLGRLPVDRFLGGAMALDGERAEQAIASIAGPFGGDTRRAAQAVIDVVNANMVRALRLISVERGQDPAEAALVAFGGAGPLHACDLADELGVATVLIPQSPGVLSALGLLQADVVKDVEQGLVLRLPPDSSGAVPQLAKTFAALERRARQALAGEGYRTGVRIERWADLRYAGQSHELRVRLKRTPEAGAIRRALARAQEERFGHSDPSRAVDIVVVRVKARAPGFRVPPGGVIAATGAGEQAREASVVWDRPRRTRVMPRAAVDRQGRRGVSGPAVLTQLDSTVLVPSWMARHSQRARTPDAEEAKMKAVVVIESGGGTEALARLVAEQLPGPAVQLPYETLAREWVVTPSADQAGAAATAAMMAKLLVAGYIKGGFSVVLHGALAEGDATAGADIVRLMRAARGVRTLHVRPGQAESVLELQLDPATMEAEAAARVIVARLHEDDPRG